MDSPGASFCWLAAWGDVCVIDLISARIWFDGGRLSVGLAVHCQAESVLAGGQDDRALASSTTAACAACRASWGCGLESGGRGAGVAWACSSTATAATTATEAGGGCDVEGEAMHSGFGRGRQRGLLPDGLDVDGFGVYWRDWSVAGGAGFDGSCAVDELEF